MNEELFEQQETLPSLADADAKELAEAAAAVLDADERILAVIREALA